MKDNRGKLIEVGNLVHVDFIDRDRGAEMWMDKGTVVGFGRTRVLVKFPSRVQPKSIGNECLRVVS